MNSRLVVGGLLTLVAVGVTALAFSRPADILFERHTIDLGSSETAAAGDLNGDGKPDIVSGEYWYEAPKTAGGKWAQHKFREIGFISTQYDNYIDNFTDHVLDVNGDGKLDVVSAAWFSKRLTWYANPGKAGGMWKETVFDEGNSVEFAFLVDLDNDGKKAEVLPQFGSGNAPCAWYEAKGGKMVKHAVSDKSYGHGIGAGDVNGDGKADIVVPKGWLEAPADPRAAGNWKFHPDFDLEKATGFIHVLDVNGDGKADLVFSNAHDYGIYWLENNGGGKWTRQLIDETWSQAHAFEMVDLNGDGKKDFLSGKRYMAHSRDPGSREPLGIYWYEYNKSADGKRVEWTRHIIDYSSRAGGGMHLPAMDMDGDGDVDLVAGGKSGLFYFENLTKRR